jgi:hypothetical protein
VTAEPAGPVLVTVEYVARPGQTGELMAALEETRFSPVTVTHWLAPQPARTSRPGGPGSASPGGPGATQP